MDKLIQHITLALFLSALVSVAIQTVKLRLKKANVTLKGNTWFATSVFISMIVAWGYTMYYNQLPFIESVMVYCIMVFGAQGFYDVLLDKNGEK